MLQTKNDKTKTPDDLFFTIGNTVFLLVAFAIVLYPILYIISASVSDPAVIVGGDLNLLPKGFNLNAYVRIFQNSNILTGYKNTIVYTVIGTAVNIIMTVLAAYPLSRSDFYGRRFFTIMIMITMFFSGGIIPTYLVVQSLGMINSFWALIIPTAVSAWNVFIMRSYFQTNIPEELLEAAMLDGCRNTRALFTIVLPLSKPIIAVLVLFYGVGHWNSYFSALIYLMKDTRFPLQLVIRQIILMNEAGNMLDTASETSLQQILITESIKYAVFVVSSAPILALYPFIQRYFVKGIMIGALKG